MNQSVVNQSSVDSALVDFIFLEARLADEARYSEWEALWHDHDALYWVPMHEGANPETELSYIYDNRTRIGKRVGQLKTGARHSQTPPSKMRRVISNFEVVATDDVSTTVESNFMLNEYRYELATWAGRYIHRIRTDGDELKLAGKTIHLINADGPVSTLAFII